MFREHEKTFISELLRLFAQAKQVDEFEFISVLMNWNGSGNSRALSHIHESQDLIKQVLALMDRPMRKPSRIAVLLRLFRKRLPDDLPSGYAQLRMLLLLYCHIFEMDDFYNILGNLLRVTQGERYAINLYNAPNTTPALKPSNKLDKLESLAKTAGYPKLITALRALYSSPLRNAFFHSSYSLSEGDFIIVRGKPFIFDNVQTQAASIRDYVAPMVTATTNIASAFFYYYQRERLQYTSNKKVQGRVGPGGVMINVEIQGHPKYGLTGFRC